MSPQRFNSVWDAIEGTPEEAAAMRLQSHQLMQLKAQLHRFFDFEAFKVRKRAGFKEQ